MSLHVTWEQYNTLVELLIVVGIIAFFLRLVPPGRAEEARLFQRSVASSFGGFLALGMLLSAMLTVSVGAALASVLAEAMPDDITANATMNVKNGALKARWVKWRWKPTVTPRPVAT